MFLILFLITQSLKQETEGTDRATAIMLLYLGKDVPFSTSTSKARARNKDNEENETLNLLYSNVYKMCKICFCCCGYTTAACLIYLKGEY